jgi:protein phosphatase
VGDSRAYLRDGDGRLEQVTRDHGMGGYITQALGLDRGVDPDVVELATPPASRLLLCSDGLSNMVDAVDIGALLGAGDATAACDALVEAALDRGGIDNVTVVVVTF